MREPLDAYKVLQVDSEADLEVIQAAYRRLAQKYHPDLAGPEPDPADARRMVEINAAWEVLRDPSRRGEYDRSRGRWTPDGSTRAPRTPPAAPANGRSAGGDPAGPGGEVPGSAGPPPGRPSGSVLNFGRYSGWSLGEISRVDPAYLEWLDRMPIGRPLRAELDVLLRKAGARPSEQVAASERRGLFRRR